MHESINVAFDHPANAGILRYLGSPDRIERSVSKSRRWRCWSPNSNVLNRYWNPCTDMGAHPDLVQRLWDEVTVRLPVQCRWIVYGLPVLVNPDSGIIFAIGMGTIYALRLPPRKRREAISAGAETVHHYPTYREAKAAAGCLTLGSLARNGFLEVGSKAKKNGAWLHSSLQVRTQPKKRP